MSAIKTSLLLLMSAMPLAAQETCLAVFDALNKVMSTPTHIISTTNGVGKPETSEAIYTADGLYSNEKGKWSRSAVTVQQVQKQELENRKKSKYTCRQLKEETVDGELATVYSTHAEAAGQKSDGVLTVSKSNGLPLRNELDIDTGGKAGKTHVSVRYDYKNVEAPKL